MKKIIGITLFLVVSLLFINPCFGWKTAAHEGAPTDAHYLVDLANGELTAEVVVSANGKALVTAVDYAAMLVLVQDTFDGRYYTETEVGTWRASVTQTEMGRLHGISANGGSLIGAVNYAAMNALLGVLGTPTERDGDATPLVAHGGFYSFTNDGALTITDFHDAGNGHTAFVNGNWFWGKFGDADITVQCHDNTNIEANADTNWTASATQITYHLFIYESARWNSPTLRGGYTNPTTYGPSSIDMGGGSLKIPTVAGDLTLASGQVGVDTAQAQLGYHDGTREVAIPSIKVIQITFDPGAWYDSDAEVWLLDMFPDRFPDGIVITKWYVDANVADPDVEMDLDLMHCDFVAGAAFPGGDPTLVDVMNTTTGNSNCTDMSGADLGSGIIPASQTLYLLFGGDPEGICTQLSIKIYYYIPES